MQGVNLCKVQYQMAYGDGDLPVYPHRLRREHSMASPWQAGTRGEVEGKERRSHEGEGEGEGEEEEEEEADVEENESDEEAPTHLPLACGSEVIRWKISNNFSFTLLPLVISFSISKIWRLLDLLYTICSLEKRNHPSRA